MMRMHEAFAGLCWLSCTVCAAAWAQQTVLEVIPLKYRRVDEVIPILQAADAGARIAVGAEQPADRAYHAAEPRGDQAHPRCYRCRAPPADGLGAAGCGPGTQSARRPDLRQRASRRQCRRDGPGASDTTRGERARRRCARQGVQQRGAEHRSSVAAGPGPGGQPRVHPRGAIRAGAYPRVRGYADRQARHRYHRLPGRRHRLLRRAARRPGIP